MTHDEWARRAVRHLVRACTIRFEAEFARYRYACDRIIQKAMRR